ncbi:MAG TPA: 2-amino-4-hydroxy-6-hydroxymethyldihydropteridine diphosphokinase [Longimicrobiales bacterium]|nr:2-amino-4-hydroxy-6-hydroxymethyldihydropteridine diphosphokinase [Longimicrobiales bacterium]
MASAYLGIGSNLGDRDANLAGALELLDARVGIDAVSSVYESEPVGYTAQPDFLNLVARVRTELAPRDLLEALQGVERELGRERHFRNAPRVIDVDLLLYDQLELSEPGLTVPHPRMLERDFVLRPLVELEPELRHPEAGRLADRLQAPDLAGLATPRPARGPLAAWVLRGVAPGRDDVRDGRGSGEGG